MPSWASAALNSAQGTSNRYSNGRGIGVAEKRTRLGQQAHAVEPFLIEGESRKVVRGQVVERSLRLGPPAEPGIEVSKCAAERRPSRILGDEIADRLLDLLEVSSEVAERVLLEPVDGDRHLRLRALAQREGLADEFLGFVEPARRCRQHRLCGADVAQLDGLPELVGDATCRVEIDLRLADVSDDELRDEPVRVPCQDTLRSPICSATSRSSLPSARHSATVSGAMMAAARPSSAYASAAGFPVRRASSTASLLSLSRRAPRGLVAQRPRQTGKEPGPELDVLLGERG